MIQKSLTGAKFTKPSKAKVHIINTCAVTEEAVKEAKRHIRRYRKKHPQDRIVVTGGAAQTETKGFSSLKEVDLVVANSHKGELTSILKGAFSKSQKAGAKSASIAPLKGTRQMAWNKQKHKKFLSPLYLKNIT